MEKIIALTSNLKEKFVYGFLILFGAWLIFALGLIFYTVFLEATGNETALQNMANQFEWKFDGTFRNDPNNIWYNADEQMFVESVTNKVVIGKLAGNRNLAFGVKNILEEFLQEKGYNLSPSAPNKLQVEIIFLDVLTTKKNISVFHKNDEEVVVRMKGNVVKNGKKGKDIIVEASSDEISMSTLAIDEGGKFNQQSLSNAIKKACESLVKEIEKQK
jgi:hypothetical protein